jgi:hypothetical protein
MPFHHALEALYDTGIKAMPEYCFGAVAAKNANSPYLLSLCGRALAARMPAGESVAALKKGPAFFSAQSA